MLPNDPFEVAAPEKSTRPAPTSASPFSRSTSKNGKFIFDPPNSSHLFFFQPYDLSSEASAKEEASDSLDLKLGLKSDLQGRRSKES